MFLVGAHEHCNYDRELVALTIQEDERVEPEQDGDGPTVNIIVRLEGL